MSDFIEFLHEVFEGFGIISSRRMFGGYGIYHEGVMFGLVADDILYLKADESTQEKFVSKGLKPFQYKKGEKTISMSYFLAPEGIYDDHEQAKIWATLAYDVAVQTKKPKKTGAGVKGKKT
jgi:DNA transformation protein and related proteins